MAMVLWAAKVLSILNLLFDQSPWILLLLVLQCWNWPALYDNCSVPLPTQANEQERWTSDTACRYCEGTPGPWSIPWENVCPIKMWLLWFAAIRGHLKVVNLLLGWLNYQRRTEQQLHIPFIFLVQAISRHDKACVYIIKFSELFQKYDFGLIIY